MKFTAEKSHFREVFLSVGKLSGRFSDDGGPKKRNAILDYGSKMVNANESRGFPFYISFFIIISKVRFVAACTRLS